MKKVSLFLLIVLVDQVLKFSAIKNLLPQTGGFLIYVCNPYISWGIPLSGLVFWLSWSVANFLLIYLLILYNRNIWLVVVLAGSVSNMIDRLQRGCVADYFRLPLGSFPIFNLADVFIVIGIIAFLFGMVGEKDHTGR